MADDLIATSASSIAFRVYLWPSMARDAAGNFSRIFLIWRNLYFAHARKSMSATQPEI